MGPSKKEKATGRDVPGAFALFKRPLDVLGDATDDQHVSSSQCTLPYDPSLFYEDGSFVCSETEDGNRWVLALPFLLYGLIFWSGIRFYRAELCSREFCRRVEHFPQDA